MDDDFIMTINDGDEVPDLEEEVVGQGKNSSAKATKRRRQDDAEEEEGDMAEEFAIDLEADGLDAVPQTLDFTLARASLKKRGNRNGMTSSLDEKIAAARRAARKAKKEQAEGKEGKKDEDSNQEESADEGSDQEENAEEGSDQEMAQADSESGSDDDNDDDDDESDPGSEEPSPESEPAAGDSSSEDSSSEESSGEDSESEVDQEKEARKRAYFATEDSKLAEATPLAFTQMNLSRQILKGLSQLEFTQATAIQARTIPVALLGKDVCGGAQTGSGKTAAFLVPILERLLYRPKQRAATRVVVLCPTRELAMQCHSVGTRLAAFTDIKLSLAVGGLALRPQEAELRTKPDIVVATPGRLVDHVRNSAAFTLEQVEILVMDEADRMLEDGFEDELEEIVRACPRQRQTMLFSATMTDDVDKLVRLSLQRPVRVQVDPPRAAASGLVQEFVRVRSGSDADRTALLAALCRRHFRHRCIIFFRSKLAAHHMKIVFGLLGLRAAELHGNLTQEARMDALESFRDGHVDFLLATDLAARGLDVTGVDTVINYTMPTQFAQYLHRVGRTARAGREGRAISLVAEPDRKILRLAVRNAPRDRIRQRVVPARVLNRYRTRVDDLAPMVQDIADQEREDRMLRDAEMQAAKANNLIAHRAEITSRPRRTWFKKDTSKKPKAS
ncbi:nucleolar DEAD-box protein required for synthesis of 60S ribosomal subunit [Coemansia sp. RSA 552]|nr:nucleolar DEAD-box protein required for synthesis of 60S ribosomal subunit [Coemansia sp. RSA 552]